MQGAGGTPGGTGRFFLGLVMLVAGIFLLLDATHVSNHFSLGYRLFNWGGYGIPSGAMLLPFMLGIGLIFFNARRIWGWVLAAGALLALLIGVISSLDFYLRPMSALELLGILVLIGGGSGLFLSGLRNYSK